MGAHVFVDETKVRGFTLVGVLVDNRDVAALRRALRSLLLPGQERIHFSKERDGRRRLVLSELSGHRLTVTVVRSMERDQGLARQDCLRTLVGHISDTDQIHLVVEHDASMRSHDVATLNAAIRERALPSSFELLEPRHDAGLWAADAIAWAIQRGGDWSRRIAMHPTVTMYRDRP